MSTFGGDDELVIHARVDNDASPELRDVRDELRGVGTQAAATGRIASGTSRSWNVMGRAAKAAAFGAKVAFGAALAGGYALVRLLKSSFAEAREAQKVGAITVQTIKATGGAAKVTAGHVGRLATHLSKVAGMDDELIQTGANLLLTFKQIRNEAGKGNKIFDRATTSAVNLAAAGFGSVDSASKMLGKALNDPLKGITALSRAGVTFTQVQQDTIKKLVEQGDLLGAQKMILKEVEGQVGGVAKAQATWGEKAGVVFGNIEEKLGTALLPLLDDVERWFVQKGAPALDRWVGIFERRGVPAIRDFAGTWLPRLKSGAQQAYDTLRPLAEEALPVAADVFDRIADTVKWLAPKLADVFEGFNGLPGWAKTAIIAGAGAGVVGQRLGVWDKLLNRGGGVLGSVTKNRPLPVWVVNNMGKGSGGPDIIGGPDSEGGGRKRTGKFGVPLLGPGMLGVLGLVASTATGSQAPGQNPTPKEAQTDWDQHMADRFAKLPDYIRLGTASLTEFDAKVASLHGVNARADALENLGKYIKGDFGEKYSPGDTIVGALENLNQYLPKTERALGMTSAKFVENRTTAQQMANYFNGYTLDALGGVTTAAGNAGDALDGINGTYRPRIDVDTASALDKINAVRTSLLNLPAIPQGSYGNGLGVYAHPTSPIPKRHHKAGGGHVAPGTAYLVGERRAEVFQPDQPGRIIPRVSSANAGSWGGVTIENLVVHAEGASSELEVDTAVVDALDRYFRDRQERE